MVVAICGKMSRLLHKPLRVFIVFSVLVLGAGIPLYHHMIESIRNEEVDEHNQYVTQQIAEKFRTIPAADLGASLRLWNQLSAFSTIVRSGTSLPAKDS